METRQSRENRMNVREMVKFSDEQKRVIMLYHFRRGLKASESVRQMQEDLQDDAPGKTAVFKWFERFESGHFDTTDDPRSGRPRISTDQATVAAVAKFLEDEPQASCKRLVDVFKIPKTSIWTILHDHSSENLESK